jgi:hypothetical protein
MKLQIDISDKAFETLPRDTAAAFQDKKKLADFCRTAAEEALAWLSGDRVYGSLTDQYIHWVEAYFPLLFPAVMPTANRLYNEFMIPAGRAAYVARILAEKRQAFWRAKAREELASAMEAKRSEAEAFMKNKDFFEPVPLTISALAERELRSIETQLFEADRTLSTYKTTNRKPDIVTVEVPAKTFVLVLDQFK